MIVARLVCLGCMVACGGTAPQPVPVPTWHASTGDEASRLSIQIDPPMTWAEASKRIGAGMCEDAVLVWGDLAVDDSVRPRAVDVVYDGGNLHAFVVCGAYMKTFLELQTANPRFKPGRGGSADLKWRAGQLFMRRRFSAADVALGQLDPPPSGVFQRGEALAAIVSVDDASVRAAPLLAAISRAPRVFVFAMLELATALP